MLNLVFPYKSKQWASSDWFNVGQPLWRKDRSRLLSSGTCVSSDTHTDHKWPHALWQSLLELKAELWSSRLATPGRNPATVSFPRRHPVLDLRARRATSGGHPAMSTISASQANQALTEPLSSLEGHQQREAPWFGSGFKSWSCRWLIKSFNLCESQVLFLFFSLYRTGINKMTP